MSDPTADALAPLADERRRLLTNQVAFSDTLRNRTTALLTVASIVAGIFGGNLVSGTNHPKPVLATIATALLLFGSSVGLAVHIMTLRKLHVGADVEPMLERVRSGESTTASGVNMTLARQYLDAYNENKPIITGMEDSFTWLSVLVAAQVVVWALAAYWP